MYPVTQDFLDKMKADRRRVLARVEIDYTDPFLDQSLTIEANEQANVSYPQQTADSVDQTTRKYACLDGTWDLTSGEYHLAPSADQLTQQQFGWWGAQFAGAGGLFVTPYPTLTVRHLPRPIRQLKVVGDTARVEYPVDFMIKLYGPDDTLLRTETVAGNNQVSWSKTLEPPVLDVAKQELIITRWSLPGTCAKIIEFFTSIREVYETGDLVSLRLLEEREASQGSLPVGNISSNEITLALNNADKKFDLDNENSPLKNLLKPNRRIQAWLGLKGDGEGMNIQQNVDFSQGELNNLVVVNNKLQLPDVGSPSFSRNSTAYLSDGTLVNTNLPRFEQGKFGKAVMVEEGTTNLLINPFFSSGLSGWSTQNATGDNKIYVTDGVVVIKAVNASPGLYQKVNLDVGTIVTVSILIRRTSGSIAPRLRWGAGPVIGEIEISENGQWVKYSAITDVQGNGNLIIEPSIAGQAEYEIKAVQVEQKPYATSFIDGTPLPERLAIPTAGVLNPQEGTVEFWVYPFNTVKTLIYDRLLFGSDGSLPGVFWCNIKPNQQLRFAYDSNGVNVELTGGTVPNLSWSRITIRWNTSGVACFINDVLVASDPRPITAISGAVLNVGCNYNARHHANILIDDLRISNRARTDEEIAAAYASGQPLPVDEWTTYKLDFDDNLNFGRGGYYISPEYDLSAVGTAATSAITWQEDPDGIQRSVYAKLDNQADWTQVVNGGKLPISTGGVLTGRKLQIKTKLIRA